jgi:membrane associated rhomboid family serine protease
VVALCSKGNFQMIEALCGCGWKWARAESAVETGRTCPKCGQRLAIACGETLPDGAGAGDFDALFDVIDGPDREGDRIFLGGVAEITVGKLDGSSVLLAGGKMVSRRHCTLGRVDFGPSRWSVVDNRSTNGLFVNGERVTSRELEDGDVVRVGEYELRYGHAVERVKIPAAEAASPRVQGGASAVVCPSCERSLPHNAKICVGCGIKVPSGRPVLISADTDESVVHGNAETYISLISWVVWVTPLPIPLMSEAFGSKKPWTIRIIALLTCLASLAVLIGSFGATGTDVPGKGLMLWPPGGVNFAAGLTFTPREVREMLSEMDAGERREFEQVKDQLRGTVPDKELDRRAIETMMRPLLEEMADRLPRPDEFRAYQLLTHAFLHDFGSVYGFALHLGGNLLFMLVFGTRVNALLGNIATAVIYPLLAIGAAGIYLWLGHPNGPMLGASGAIMGLAGMYLVLFPVHRVYCGMWFRFRWWVTMKIFAVRGFWVLLIYFAYDAVMVALGVASGTAHWAHLGGFSLGVLIAVGLLVSRQFNCGGGDLLSVVLGRHAWGLIGRPGRWNRPLAA